MVTDKQEIDNHEGCMVFEKVRVMQLKELAAPTGRYAVVFICSGNDKVATFARILED